MRIAKTLLVAAALVGATTTTTKAYDLFGSGWDYSQPGFTYGSYPVGDDWTGREYRALDGWRDTSFGPFLNFNANETDLVNAGVYRGISGSFTWSGNEYNSSGSPGSAAFVFGVLESGPIDGDGDFVDASGDYDGQSGFFTEGTFLFDSRDETTNVTIGNNGYAVYMELEGNYFGGFVSGGATVYEREVQVARTGSGDNGANALSAFAADNSATLSGSFYNANIVGRNVLPFATSTGVTLVGSVVRQADIALGFLGSEGLFAKDGGWLDIRGDLTLGASGTIYIRDGEITSNIYTQFYSPGTLDTVGRLAIESGILSVRERFAQDMAVTWGQTLGFRDGAVNESRLILEGIGYVYGFDGEGELALLDGNSAGALRSITGNNIQNGNITVVADGEGFFPLGGNGAAIGTDLGSTLTINGTVNGLNSGASEGGALLAYFSEGSTVQNGRILSGISFVLKAGEGELLLTAANLFTGDLQVQDGSVRITNSGALSGASGDTLVADGASLVLDHATGLSLAEDIRISGDGKTGVGGALHNKSGANATTGNLWVDSTNGGPDTTPSLATVTVAASSSLTVANIRGASLVNTLTVDVSGAATTAGAFTVLGNTGALDNFYKNGTGNATLTTLSAALDDIDVNAGNLLVLGSESAGDNIFDDLDIDGTLGLDGKPLGSLELRGNHHYIELNVDMVDVLIKGSVTHHGGEFNDLDINGNATVTVDTGATLTTEQNEDADASADIEDASTLVIKGTFQANGGSYIDLDDEAVLEVRTGGVANSRIVADDASSVILRTGGRINGDVETWEDAEFLIESGSTHDGDYEAYGSADIVVNGTIGLGTTATSHVFDLSGSARLSGSGTLTGNLLQTNGVVAPGNSVETLTVLGNYSISAGKLEVEIGGIAGAGVDPNGNDQLAVGGTVTVSGTAILDFQPYNGFESTRGNPAFQVLSTVAGAPRATIGTFNTVELAGLNDRVLFDHSTGRAYGTGLALTGFETFRDYGDNANRREVGRALWMEAVAHDNSLTVDENFDTFAINDFGPGDETGQVGLKAFLLTRNASLVDNTQVGTDLGAAAAFVLTAPDVGAALDSLSPEVYVGFTELSTRLNRSFSLLGATGRRSGDEKKWGFNLGYSGEQLTSGAGSAYSSFKAGTNTAYLTADFALTAQTHLNLSLGTDNGNVSARDFDGDADSELAGIGISYTTDSSFARIDLGASFSTTDIRAVRQGGVMDQDDQDAHAISLRVTFLPKDPPLKPAVAGKAPETPRLSIIPYVGISQGSSSLDAFTESAAAGTVQLSVDGFDRNSFVGELGFGLEYALGDSTTLTGILAYEHEFDSKGETDVNAAFVEDGVSDTEFGIRSDGIGAGIFRLGFGIRQKIADGSSFGLSYDALMGGGIDSGHHLKADVSFRF